MTKIYSNRFTAILILSAVNIQIISPAVADESTLRKLQINHLNSNVRLNYFTDLLQKRIEDMPSDESRFKLFRLFRRILTRVNKKLEAMTEAEFVSRLADLQNNRSARLNNAITASQRTDENAFADFVNFGSPYALGLKETPVDLTPVHFSLVTEVSMQDRGQTSKEHIQSLVESAKKTLIQEYTYNKKSSGRRIANLSPHWKEPLKKILLIALIGGVLVGLNGIWFGVITFIAVAGLLGVMTAIASAGN